MPRATLFNCLFFFYALNTCPLSLPLHLKQYKSPNNISVSFSEEMDWNLLTFNSSLVRDDNWLNRGTSRVFGGFRVVHFSSACFCNNSFQALNQQDMLWPNIVILIVHITRKWPTVYIPKGNARNRIIDNLGTTCSSGNSLLTCDILVVRLRPVVSPH